MSWTMPRIKEVIFLIIRYSFWFVFIEVWLNSIYHSAIISSEMNLYELDLWSLTGIGYSTGQFFMVKYVVYYGLPRLFMKVDGIDPPDTPKCIGRIHLYSDIWRYFDPGLHRFLHRYVFFSLKYVNPCTGLQKKEWPPVTT